MTGPSAGAVSRLRALWPHGSRWIGIQFDRSTSWAEDNGPVLFAAILLTAVTTLYLVGYVQTACAGQTWACFLPGELFPVPDFVQARSDIKPVHPDGGWDGQFYLYQAYDPFIRHAEEVSATFDAAAYRYQRILIPLLANGLHHIVPVTPEVAYMAVQVAIIFIGTLVVGQYLLERGWSLWFLLPLHFNAGVMATLRNGLPDASADFLFFIVCVAILKGRHIWAAVTLAALLLAREPYAVFAFLFGSMRALQILFAEVPGGMSIGRRLARAVPAGGLYALPILVYGAWYLYVLVHLGSPTTQGASMLSMPFQGWWQALATTLAEKPWWEMVSLNYFAGVLLVGMAVCALAIRRSPIALAGLGMCAITACIAWVGWHSWPHHSKNFSFVLGLAVLVAASAWPARRQLWLAPVVAPAAALGLAISTHHLAAAPVMLVHGNYEVRLDHPLLVDRPHMAEKLLRNTGYDPELDGSPFVRLTDNRAVVTADRTEAVLEDEDDLLHLGLHFENTSDQPWSPLYKAGEDPVRISVMWHDEDGALVSHQAYPLNRYVRPGEAMFADLVLDPPVDEGGRYVLTINLAQAPAPGVAPLVVDAPGAVLTVDLEIR